MKGISKQDPAFREKVQDLERLNSVRSDLVVQVFKLLTDLIKSTDYKLLSCSVLDEMKSDYSSPSKEFRFLFVREVEDLERPL